MNKKSVIELVRNQFNYQVWDYVSDKVWAQVYNQVDNQVWDYVSDKVRDQVHHTKGDNE
jgi:hypothetical protein